MIPQQELQKLIGLPVREKLELARLLIDSSLNDPPRNGDQHLESATPAAADSPSASAQWLMAMAGRYSSEPKGETIPFLSLAGMYEGPTDTAERADEICQEEIKKRSGFTLKEELL